MNLFISGSLIFLMFLFLLGCSTDKDKLVGKWMLSSVKENNEEVDVAGGTIEFKEDGSFIGEQGGETFDGGWTMLEKDSIIVDFKEEREDDLFGKYEFEGDKLHIRGKADNDVLHIQFIKEKK